MVRISRCGWRLLPGMALLVAFGSGEALAAGSAAARQARADPPPAPSAAPVAGQRAEMVYAGEGVDFSYSWPVHAVRIPALDAWLRGNAGRLRADTVRRARAARAEAAREGYVFHDHGYGEDWAAVADLDALLVMQSEGYRYAGGAHGMPIVTTLIWDRAAGTRRALGALFDMPALVAAIRARFCAALDAQRAARRGAPVDPNDADQLPEFVRCVDPAKQTILPVSTGGRALDTIRLVVMPYEAGPYAEGIYEIDLPVDAAVLRAVRPAWRGAFGAGGPG